jgi:hypothetical protein
MRGVKILFLTCKHLLLLELLGNRLIEPVFFNSLPKTGLSISFLDDLYFVFPLVGI